MKQNIVLTKLHKLGYQRTLCTVHWEMFRNVLNMVMFFLVKIFYGSEKILGFSENFTSFICFYAVQIVKCFYTSIYKTQYHLEI